MYVVNCVGRTAGVWESDKRNELTNGKLLLWCEVSQQVKTWEDAGKEQELDRCHTKTTLQWELTMPGNYGYCQIYQETFSKKQGGGREWRAYYKTCHPPPIGTISCIYSIKDNQGCPPPVRSREMVIMKIISYLNYLNVSRETLFLTVLNTCKQKGKNKNKPGHHSSLTLKGHSRAT